MRLLITSAFFLLLVALTQQSPTKLDTKSHVRRVLKKVKNHVKKTSAKSTYNAEEEPFYSEYEPSHPKEANNQISVSQLNKLFGIRSAISSAQSLFEKAKNEIEEMDDQLEQIVAFIGEAENEVLIDQFEQHCIGIGLYDGGAPPIEVIGNKCYVYYEDLKSYDESSDACKQTGGLLAEADTSPGSIWGSQIVKAFGPLEEDVRVSGVYFDAENMIFENSGLKINKNDDLWLSNNVGPLSENPEFVEDISSVVLKKLIDEDDWFLDIIGGDMDLPYLCEYKLNYQQVSK